MCYIIGNSGDEDGAGAATWKGENLDLLDNRPCIGASIDCVQCVLVLFKWIEECQTGSATV